MKIAIIIPAYNEEKRIGPTLLEYSSFFDALEKEGKLKYKIIVVINNTKDRTKEVVESFQKKNNRISYLNLVKGGKGYAVIEGFKEALNQNVDLIGFTDADLATSPCEFYKLIQNLTKYDGVIASRYLKGSKVYPRQSLQRIVASRIFNLFIRGILFLPYRDTQCGAKVFSSDALRKIIPSLTMSQWAFDVDSLYQLKIKRYSIREIPIAWSDKEYSKINLMSSGSGMALGVLRLRILNSPFSGFIRLYGKYRGQK